MWACLQGLPPWGLVGDPARCFLPSSGQHTALPVASSQEHLALALGSHRYSYDQGPCQGPKLQASGLLRAVHTCLLASQEQRPVHWAGGEGVGPTETRLPTILPLCPQRSSQGAA